MPRRYFMIAQVMLIVAAALSACGEEDRAKREAEQAKRVREEAERSTRYKAEREAESKLFADPMTAEATLNKRIDDWITRRGGLLLVRGGWMISQRPLRTTLNW